MKSIYFKKKDTVFRSLQEQKIEKPKKRINWDRIVYMILLFTFLFFVGKYAFFKVYYVKADGQVLSKNINIQNLEDCRIVHFLVKEGSTVKKGDTLFYFTNKVSNAEFENPTKKSNWQEKDLIYIDEDLALLRKENGQLRKKYNRLDSNLEKIRQEVLLDILPKSTFLQKENELHDVEDQLEMIENKIQLLLEKKGRIQYSLSEVVRTDNKNTSQTDYNTKAGPQPFLAPVDGLISKIFKENTEVVMKSEVIMYVQQVDDIFVKAFFEQTDLKYLKNRSIVEVEFPDGTKSKGRISRFYHSTYQLPEEFQKKYEPTTRSLAVDVVPYNEYEFKKWISFYKLSVIVRKKRFNGF